MKRTSLLLLSLVVLSGGRPASADLGDFFENVRNVNWWAESAPLTPADSSDGEAGLAQCTDCDGCTQTACDVDCDPMFVPNMIGDSLGVPKLYNGFNVIHRPFSKVSDNNSPRPRDRVYAQYQYFHNALLVETIGNAGDVNFGLQTLRFGVEKTFLDGDLSAEFIVPILFSNDSTIQPAPGPTRDQLTDTELGNLAFGVKYLLASNNEWDWSIGLRVESPTDEDHDFGFGTLRTDAWYFTPYMGWIRRGDRWFAQGFVGIRLRHDSQMLTGQEVGGGEERDPDFFFADIGIGYWWYQNPDGFLTGIAPTLELHYQTTTEGDPNNFLTNAVFGPDVSNLTLLAGVTAMFRDNATLAVGFAFPLRTTTSRSFGLAMPTDRLFDWELAVQFNMFFGRK